MFSFKDLTLVIENDEIDEEELNVNLDGYYADEDVKDETDLPIDAPKQKRPKQIVIPLAETKPVAATQDRNVPTSDSKPPVHKRSPSVLEYRLISTPPSGGNFDLYPESTKTRANQLFFSTKKDASISTDGFIDSATSTPPHASQKPS